MFARTYAPSKVPEVVEAWKADLKGRNKPKIAERIADPRENPELFEEGWGGGSGGERSGSGEEEEEEKVNGVEGEFFIFGFEVGWVDGWRCFFCWFE